MEDELRVHGIQNVDFRVLFCLQSDLSPLEGCNGPSLSDWASLPSLSRGFEKRWMHSTIALTRQRQAAVTRQRQENRTVCELVQKIDKIHRLVNNTREYLQRDPKLTQSRWEALVERRVEHSERSLHWSCCLKYNDMSASGPSGHIPVPMVQQLSAPTPPSTSISHDQDGRTGNINESRKCSEPNETSTTRHHLTPPLPANEEAGSIHVALSRSEPNDNPATHRDSSPKPFTSIDPGQGANGVSTEPLNLGGNSRDFPTSHLSAHDASASTTLIACLHCKQEGFVTSRRLAFHGKTCPKTPSSALAKTMAIVAKQCVICGRECLGNTLSRHEKSPHYLWSYGKIATAKGHEECPEVPTRLDQCARGSLVDPVRYLMSARWSEATTDSVLDTLLGDLPPEELGLLTRLSDEELCAKIRKALTRCITLVRPYHSPDSGIGTDDLSYWKGSANRTAGESVGHLNLETNRRVWHANAHNEAASAIYEPEKMAGLGDEQIFFQPPKDAGLTVVDDVPATSTDYHRPATNNISSTASHTSSLETMKHKSVQHSAYRVWDTSSKMAKSGIGSPIAGRGYPLIAPIGPMPGCSAAGRTEDAISCLQDGIPLLPRDEGVSVFFSAAGTINTPPSAAIATSTQHSEGTLLSATSQTPGARGMKRSAPCPMPIGINTGSQHALACAGYLDGDDPPAKRPRVSHTGHQSSQTHAGPPFRQQATFPYLEQLGMTSPKKLPSPMIVQDHGLAPPTAPRASSNAQASHHNGKETSHQPPTPPPIRGFQTDESLVPKDAKGHLAMPYTPPAVGHTPHLDRSSWQVVAFRQTHSESQHIPSPPSDSSRTVYGDPAPLPNVISDQPSDVGHSKNRRRQFARFTIPADIQATLGEVLFTGIGHSSLGKEAMSQSSTLQDAVVTEVPNDNDTDWVTKLTLSSSYGRVIQQWLEEEGVRRLMPKLVSDAILASQRHQNGETAIQVLFHGDDEDCRLEFAMDNAQGTEVFLSLHAVSRR